MPRGSKERHHRDKSHSDSDSSSPTRRDNHGYTPSKENVESLKRLLQVQKKLDELNSHAKLLRKDKASLQKTVLDFMKKNRVGDIALKDGCSLIRKETQRNQPLTKEQLEKGLARRFRITQEEVHEIILQIKASTQMTSKESLQFKRPPKKKSKPTN